MDERQSNSVDRDVLDRALRHAVAKEDYAEAARLKAEISDAEAREELLAVTRADSHQKHLLGNINKILRSTSSGVVVLHWTSAQHPLPNNMFRRVASVFAGSCIAFYVVTTSGIEQLRAGVRTSLALPPMGWRVEPDEETGMPHYVGPRGERLLSEAAVEARARVAEFEIMVWPTTQIWRDGVLVQEVGTVALEAALRKYVEDDNLYDKPPGVAGDCA